MSIWGRSVVLGVLARGKTREDLICGVFIGWGGILAGVEMKRPRWGLIRRGVVWLGCGLDGDGGGQLQERTGARFEVNAGVNIIEAARVGG